MVASFKLKQSHFALFITFVFTGIVFYLPVLQFFFGADPLDETKSLFVLRNFFLFIKKQWLFDIILFTLIQAFLSAILSLIIGLVGAWVFKSFSFSGKSLITAILFLPFILPSFVVILGIILFYGNNGWINQMLRWLFSSDDTVPIQFLYSLSGIILAHVYYNFPLALKIILFQWEKISDEYLHASRILGKNSIQSFFRVYLPLLYPSMRSAFFIIFLLCINSFAIILVLGANFGLYSVEIAIYQQALQQLNFSNAIYLSLIQLLINIVIVSLLFQKQALRINQRENQPMGLFFHFKKQPIKALVAFFYLVCMLIFILGPLLAIVIDSLTIVNKNQVVFDLHWYRLIIASWIEKKMSSAIVTSITIGFYAAIISGVLGIIFSYFLSSLSNKTKSFFEIITNLPLILSSVIFGLAWQVYFIRSDVSYVPKWFVLICIHSILFYPFWMRVMMTMIEKTPENWQLVRSNLGVKKLTYYYRIMLPWLKNALIAGFLLSFCLSLGEFNTSFMLLDESFETLPIQMQRAVGSYRFSYASAIGVILIFICGISFFLLNKLFLLNKK